MRKIIAILIAVVLVFPLIIAAQVLGSVNSFVLDRNFYIESMDSDKVYESLLSDDTIAEILGEYLPLPAGTDYSQIGVVLRSVISRDYLKEQVAIFINGFFDYLQGKSESFTPVVDLQQIKSVLAEEKLDEMVRAIAAILPICEPGQVPGINLEENKACKPAGLSDEVLSQDYLKPVFPLILSMVPNEIAVGDKWEEIRDNRIWGPIYSGMALPASMMLAAIILGGFAACFWYITALIADNSWRLRLLWLGWMLIIPSALIFILGLAVSADIPGYWINYGIEHAGLNGILFGVGLREALRAVVSSSLVRVASSFMMVGGISSAIGLGFIFWGLATKKSSGAS